MNLTVKLQEEGETAVRGGGNDRGGLAEEGEGCAAGRREARGARIPATPRDRGTLLCPRKGLRGAVAPRKTPVEGQSPGKLDVQRKTERNAAPQGQGPATHANPREQKTIHTC